MNEQELQLAHAAQRREDERRLKTIVSDLWHHGEQLVRAEVELGIDEINRRVEEGKVAARNAAIIGGLFYAAYLSLLAALVLGLGAVMPTWAAALVVGLFSAGAGYLLVQREKQVVKKVVHPETSQLPHNIAPRAQH